MLVSFGSEALTELNAVNAALILGAVIHAIGH
jgi:hypothetical protein